ncbi:hypothetical protein KJ671_02900 [Patescibacteria group bacterium]|nr:hypothetical protein [Patescibacteria group bacterium]
MNGNKLEEQVENILKENSYEQITIGAYYKDPNTGKPREKDIIATLPQLQYNDIIAYNAKLFIECKVFPEETEIYSETVNMSEVENVIFTSNLPRESISEIERHKKLHFYRYKEIFRDKDSKDYLYKAIIQNLLSFESFRENLPGERGVYYLIVVYDDKLKAINEDGNKKNCNRALIRTETIDKTFSLPQKKCFTELVSIDQLKYLLQEINEDIKEINNHLLYYYARKISHLKEKRKRIKKDQDYS